MCGFQEGDRPLRLDQTISRYWRAFVLWRQHEKLKNARERLDQEVGKRQEEASKLGITDMLMDIYKNGHGYQPWIGSYQSGSPQRSVTFLVKSKTYTIKWDRHDSPFDGVTTVTIPLQAGDRELFRDCVKEDCDDFGLKYAVDPHGNTIGAYVPGEWVKDLRTALDAVANHEKNKRFKEKHSEATLEDLKSKFGL